MGILILVMAEPDLPDIRVLIADDAATIRGFIEKALPSTAANVFIEETDNGADCFKHLSQFDYDLSFIDVNLPGLTGMDALTQARELGSEAFVVIMSGEMTAENRDLARALNAYEYLVKPFEAADVAATLECCIRVKKPTRVLIVDDSATTRKVIRKVLSGTIFNFEFDEADNGASAIAAYEQKKHDIVFLDINMPGIDGFETLELLRKRNPRVQVVLMTADHTAALLETAKAQGVQAFLYKPFFADQVNLVLHDLFGLRPPGLADAETEIVPV